MSKEIVLPNGIVWSDDDDAEYLVGGIVVSAELDGPEGGGQPLFIAATAIIRRRRMMD